MSSIEEIWMDIPDKNSIVPTTPATIEKIIEKAQEEAVRGFVGTIRLNGCSVADKYDAPKTRIPVFVALDHIEKLMEQYLKYRKEKTNE
jgi:hypothetical protein